MTFDEAKAYLNTLHRDRLYDLTFGDEELYWSSSKDGDGNDYVASGYFSRDVAEVVIGPMKFSDAEAQELRNCGVSFSESRNDGQS